MTDSTTATVPTLPADASTEARQTVQVYHVFIKASPQQIWDAITTPEWSERYFYGARITATPDAYSSKGPDGSDWGSSEVLEFDPPRRLVHGWTSAYDPDLSSEPASRVSWEITPGDDGVSLLTVTHDQLDGSPRTAASVSGPGWMRVLSGLKTVLETGQPLG